MPIKRFLGFGKKTGKEKGTTTDDSSSSDEEEKAEKIKRKSPTSKKKKPKSIAQELDKNRELKIKIIKAHLDAAIAAFSNSTDKDDLKRAQDCRDILEMINKIGTQYLRDDEEYKQHFDVLVAEFDKIKYPNKSVRFGPPEFFGAEKNNNKSKVSNPPKKHR